jgi:Fe2+ transport system protein B
MSDLGSTSLDNLPTNNNNNNENENENKIINNPIQKINEERNKILSENKVNVNNSINNTNMQNDINTQLKKASLMGATKLQSRDIPMDTNVITQDEQIQNDFIPKENNNNNDYITEHLSTEDIIKKNLEKNENDIFLDKLYSEISLPLLIAVLYFIFKLPFIDNIYNKFFPFCFSKTGNMKISGYLISSIVFSSVFYFINKLIKNFNI